MNAQKIASLRPIARRRFMQMCAGSLGLAAVGCGRREDRAYSRGSTIIIASDTMEVARNPREGTPAKFLLFLPLVTVNPRGELEGRLARRWAHSPDSRKWTYYLRPGVRWHDGVPVTAHDIKFSLELLSHPDVLENAPVESITVLDDLTLTIRDQPPNAQVWEVYFPKHLLEHLDPKKFYNWELWTRPVGNGPYRLVRHLPGTMTELEANPDYYRGKLKIERVVFKYAAGAGLSELLSGNVDALMNANPALIPKLVPDPRFQVFHSYNRAIYGAEVSGDLLAERAPLLP